MLTPTPGQSALHLARLTPKANGLSTQFAYFACRDLHDGRSQQDDRVQGSREHDRQSGRFPAQQGTDQRGSAGDGWQDRSTAPGRGFGPDRGGFGRQVCQLWLLVNYWGGCIQRGPLKPSASVDLLSASPLQRCSTAQLSCLPAVTEARSDPGLQLLPTVLLLVIPCVATAPEGWQPQTCHAKSLSALLFE